MKKVFNQILASALSLGVISGNINTIPSIVKAEEFVDNGFSIANEIGLNTNSVEVAEDLEKLSILNNNAFEITVSEDNEVSQINGLLSDISVNYGSDALAVIDGISDLLGIDSTYRELKLENCTNSLYNDIYTFKQYYNGLEMVNSCITVIVDKETREPKFLNSSYNSNFSVDTTPSVSENQALGIVKEKYEDYSGKEPRLVIYTDNDNVSSLAWECNADTLTTGRIYVDAVNGGIIFEENLVNNAEDSDALSYHVDSNPLMPNVGSYSVKLDIDENANIFYFRDKSGKFAHLNGSDYWAMNEEDGDNTYTNFYTKKYGPVQRIEKTDYNYNMLYATFKYGYTNDLLREYKEETALLYNLQKAYDFYDKIFNWHGADGKGGTVYAVPAVKYMDGTYLDNAFAYFGRNLLVFGGSWQTNNGLEFAGNGADPDVVVHEFTHLVTHSKLEWGGSSNIETAALGEAYSDIMAEYADETPEWKEGTDRYNNNYDFVKYFCRDHSNPYYENYDGLINDEKAEAHNASTIISHVAFLMHKPEKDSNVIEIPDEVAMRIWYNSLDYMKTTDMDFKACRNAVINAIHDVVDKEFNGKYKNFEDDYKKTVRYAFDSVRIYGN